MSNRRGSKLSAALAVCRLVLGAASLVALAQGAPAQEPADAVVPAHPVVSVEEQAARDAERVRILEAELAKEQQHADEAARLRALRLAAGDAVAAEEVEQARLRSLGNITALRRELAMARSPSATIRSVRASGAVLPSRRVPDGAAAWWDVYARSRPEQQPAVVAASPARH